VTNTDNETLEASRRPSFQTMWNWTNSIAYKGTDEYATSARSSWPVPDSDEQWVR